MRYLPVLDARESVWRAGEAVLAIGAGPDLVLRKRVAGREDAWWGYECRHERAGKDDVTALRLLRQRGRTVGEVAIVGRANGRLEMVALRTDAGVGLVGAPDVLQHYETGGLPVKSAAVLHGGAGSTMLSAVLGNSSAAIYPVRDLELEPTAPQASVSEIVLADSEIPWMTAFLSRSLLALGATSSTPLRVFSLADSRSTPLRTFPALECTGAKTTGVYAIAALPTSAGSAEAAGDVFLGGWYDGVSRYYPIFVRPSSSSSSTQLT